MHGLTEKQSAVFQAILELSKQGHSPSYDELAAATGMKSRGQVSFQLHRLKERGLIDWEPNRSRSIRVIDQLANPEAMQRMSAEALQSLVENACDLLAKRMGRAVAVAILQGALHRLKSQS